MNIIDIVNRSAPSLENIDTSTTPWHNEEFGRRALKEQLNQEHDEASRKLEHVQKQVAWIHQKVLGEKTSNILDLCCGHGLYTNMLAHLGHHCKGIDYAFAAIEYARITKIELMLDCEYQLADIRNIDYGRGFDLTINLLGEINKQTKEDASKILKNINAALTEDGLLFIELFSFETIEEMGNLPPTWISKEEGRFSSKPHLVLSDYQWVPGENYSIIRNYIIHSENMQTEVYTKRLQAYAQKDYDELFEKNGFTIINKFPSLANERNDDRLKVFGLLLKKIA
ncbi:MAG: class I SAM-dependent methyltransferase [Bacteroidales bacterium]|nr:class I SAM-dependent methyltransferase [Bacteroidales bacterium]